MKKASRIDATDVLLVLGVGLSEVGTWLIYHPAAFLIGGLFSFIAVYLIHRANTPQGK
jgi:hypothetical protein